MGLRIGSGAGAMIGIAGLAALLVVEVGRMPGGNPARIFKKKYASSLRP